MKLIKKILFIILSLLFSVYSVSATEPNQSDYINVPLFLSESVPPNILIMLDNSGSMNFKAYNETYTGAPYKNMEAFALTSADDAEEINDCGAGTDCIAYFDNGDLDIGRDPNAGYPNTNIGIRFSNIQLEQYEEIGNAYIQFNTQETYGGAGSPVAQTDITVTIHGQDVGDAPVFEKSALNITKRIQTDTSVSWTITDKWETANEKHNTPDLTAIVQEIINRDDWVPGNSIVFTITNPGANPDSGRTASSRDAGADKAPRLVITKSHSSAKKYYGYFNPDYFYKLESSNFVHQYKKVSYIGNPETSSGYWSVLKKDGSDEFTIPHNLIDTEIATDDDTGLFDGNWMNWMTTRRIDALRKVIFGGKATGRTGTGNQVNYGESSGTNRNFTKWMNTTNNAAVNPYDGNYKYQMEKNSLSADTDNSDTFTNSDPSYTIAVKKDPLYEPENFHYYDGSPKLSGVMQKVGEKANWGIEFFREDSNEGGSIDAPIGTNMTDILTSLSNKACETWTPLAEAYYSAMMYFKQIKPTYTGYKSTEVVFDSITKDPYYDKDRATTIPCAKSFVILLTDGASTEDQNIPLLLRDTDGDGDEDDLEDWDNNGSGYLDDIALYARTTDLRPPGLKNLEGNQNLYLYTVYAFDDDPKARNLLQDAAKNGGFDDLNGDNYPGEKGVAGSYTKEWDKNGDGVPDTYYEAKDGGSLETELLKAITDILKRAASGTAVSVLSTSGEGEGNLVQAYFKPIVTDGLEEANWVGYLQSLWVDSDGNMREDTVQDQILNTAEDNIVQYTVIDDVTKIALFYPGTNVEPVQVSENPPKWVYPEADEIISMESVKPVWEAGSRLADRDPDDRKIFTYIDKDNDQVIDEFTYVNHDSDGELIDFNTGNAELLKPYLGVDHDATWEYLGNSADNRAENIIKFIRGNDDGFSGSTSNLEIRSRNIDDKVWKLGDIIHSTPTSISMPLENYDLLYGDQSYGRYFEATKERETVVYVGGNDGMLHAFTSWKYNKGYTYTVSGVEKTENPKFTQPKDETGTSLPGEIGDELWAYIPQALLPHLKWLPGEDYGHVSYVDSKPKVFDAKILPVNIHYPDTSFEGDTMHWGTFILFGLNMGGKHIWSESDFDDDGTKEVRHFYPSYTLIDITDARNPRVMWERSYAIPEVSVLTAENDTDQGMSSSYSNIIKINERWFAVIGSGPGDFDGKSANNGHIFIIDLETGEPVQSSDSFGKPVDWLFETDDLKGLMAPAVSLDKNFSYDVDAIYIGESHESINPDWEGAMYKINIPDHCPVGEDCVADPSKIEKSEPENSTDPWVMSKMFDSPGPITAAPVISSDSDDNIWIYVGTGRYFSDDDEMSTDQQYLFGIKDPFYHKFKYEGTIYDNITGASALTLDTGNLLNTDDVMIFDPKDVGSGVDTVESQSYSDLHNFSDLVYKISGKDEIDPITDIPAKDGWIRSLTLYDTERSLTKPAILGGMTLFTTYSPKDEICSQGGDATIYGLYYLTGTSFYKTLSVKGKEVTYVPKDNSIAIIDTFEIGEGMPSAPAVHAAKKNTAFVQKSTGEVVEIEFETPEGIKSGLTTWEEK